jgi:hypothetical protein
MMLDVMAALLLYECAFAGKANWREQYLCCERCEIAETVGIEGVFDYAHGGTVGHEWGHATGGMKADKDAEDVEGGVGGGDLGAGIGEVLENVLGAGYGDDDVEVGADNLLAGDGCGWRADEEEDAGLAVFLDAAEGAVDVAAKVFGAFGEDGDLGELGEALEALGDGGLDVGE